MNAYETSATVEDQGRVQVAGVPFAPGSEVDVRISPKSESIPDDNAFAAARDRMRELFRTTVGFRNSPRIAREELHERGHIP